MYRKVTFAVEILMSINPGHVVGILTVAAAMLIFFATLRLGKEG